MSCELDRCEPDIDPEVKRTDNWFSHCALASAEVSGIACAVVAELADAPA
jgi:hypothetical protein